MRLKPIYHKKILNYPYFKGIRTGFLIGFGTAWIIQSLLYGMTLGLIGGFIVFLSGSIIYLNEIKENHTFLK